MFSFCAPFPGEEIVCLKKKDFGPVLSRFDGLPCTAQWTLHLHEIWYVASVSPHKTVSLPCIFRQGKVFLAMRYPDHVTQFATFGGGHVLGLTGHCSRTISCKIRGPPGPKHCQLQTSDLELIFRWRINQTLSDPNWRLYTGFCVNSVWSGGGSKDMTKPWGWGKKSFLGQCWSRHLKTTFLPPPPLLLINVCHFLYFLFGLQYILKCIFYLWKATMNNSFCVSWWNVLNVVPFPI